MGNSLEILSKIKPDFSSKLWEIDSQQVHLWYLDLNPPEVILKSLISLLAEDEKTKAERYKFKQSQICYQVVHSTLRIILGRYLDLDPKQINFIYSDRGKPFLADNCNPLNLQFNLSHSENIAIFAITCDRRIGVDIESLRSPDNILKLAQRFFCPSEYTLLNQAIPEEQNKLFFQLWTAKEAYLKATGEGISGGLNQVEIALNPLQIVSLIEETEPKKWHLESFCLNLDKSIKYWVAIAVEGRIENIQIQPLLYF